MKNPWSSRLTNIKKRMIAISIATIGLLSFQNCSPGTFKTTSVNPNTSTAVAESVIETPSLPADGNAPDAADDASDAIQQNELLVDVYLYKFEAVPAMNYTLDRAEIDNIFQVSNQLWVAAGIKWKMNSIQEVIVSSTEYPALTGSETTTELKNRLSEISPIGASGRRWKLVILRTMNLPAGGVYLPDTQTAYFSELKGTVEMGPIIAAHELGHSLGLPHVSDTLSLMHDAAGSPQNTTSPMLSQAQIDTALVQAAIGPIYVPKFN